MSYHIPSDEQVKKALKKIFTKNRAINSQMKLKNLVEKELKTKNKNYGVSNIKDRVANKRALQKEFDLELPELINRSIDIYSLLGNTDQSTSNWKADARSAMSLYQMLDDCKAKHQSMILDALLEALVRVEQTRRKSVASSQLSIVDEIIRWQDDLRSQTGLSLILKGEYIMGRHRRSTILIVPKIGVVIKQPGPEPFHEVKLAAKYYDGKPENWPSLTEDGALVTPAGRIRIIFEQGLVEMLNNTFDHPMELNTLLGVTLEPYEPGPTMQTYVLEQPTNLNTELYEQVVIHQLVAEQLGVENGDWHWRGICSECS